MKDLLMPELIAEKTVDYISPNSLLLSQAMPEGDLRSFKFYEYSYKRLEIIQGEMDRFWRKWSQLAGPNLFVRNKRNTRECNVAVPDIFLGGREECLKGSVQTCKKSVLAWTGYKGDVRDVNVSMFPSYPVYYAKLA